MNSQTSPFLYRQVMNLVSQSIEGGVLQAGDRLPSLRKMSDRAGVSVPTVRQAYVELERLRRIESRPRSGFFVRHVAEPPLVRSTPVGRARPRPFSARPLVQRVFDGIDRPDLVPLGIVSPSMAKPAGRSPSADNEACSLEKHGSLGELLGHTGRARSKAPARVPFSRHDRRSGRPPTDLASPTEPRKPCCWPSRRWRGRAMSLRSRLRPTTACSSSSTVSGCWHSRSRPARKKVSISRRFAPQWRTMRCGHACLHPRFRIRSA